MLMFKLKSTIAVLRAFLDSNFPIKQNNDPCFDNVDRKFVDLIWDMLSAIMKSQYRKVIEVKEPIIESRMVFC